MQVEDRRRKRRPPALLYDARRAARRGRPLQNEPPVPAPTARLFFRRWTAADLPLALTLWGDPRVTALIGGPFDGERVGALLASQIAADLQYWALFLRADSAFVGCCGLRPRPPGATTLEIGFHLRPERWGQGLAVEAARAVIGFAFTALGAAQLFAGHHPDNAASARTLQRLGFRHTHDELYPPTGRLHRSYLLTPADTRAPAS
jgi:RimJ/RimL family protein N-acetyltransferase